MQFWRSHLGNRSVLLLLLGGLAFRGLVAFYLPPGFDEAYYYLYTLHPNWSYFDHPPLVALVTGFGVWLTGQVSQFTIRLGALLLYTGTLVFLYLTARKLFAEPAAKLTLAIATLIPIFQLGFGVLTLPDSPLMFFWAACLYVAAHEFFPDTPSYKPTARLALISLLVGLACLGKYHGFLLGLGLVGFCLSSDRHRVALTSGWTGLGVVLFSFALLPVLGWNAQHGWISLVYQSSRAAPTQPYQLMQSLVTGLLGIAYLFPTFGLPLWWAIAKSAKSVGRSIAAYRTVKSPNPLLQKQQLILWVSLPLILGLLYVGGYQPILPTWQMPGFWTTTLLLGYWAAQWQAKHPLGVRRWIVGSGMAIAILVLVALSHVSAGSLQKPGGWLGEMVPIASDASTQMVDIQQLRQGFLDSPTLLRALQESDFIFTNQIFLAGQVAMALTPAIVPTPITCFSNDPRGFAFWSEAETWLGKDGLYLTSARFENEGKLLPDYFQSFLPLGEIPIQRAGATVETFKVFRAVRLLRPYPFTP